MSHLRTSPAAGRAAPAPAPASRPASAQDGIGNRGLRHLLASGMMRTKSAVSRPGDADERAADALADRVLAGGGCAAPAPCPSRAEAPVLRQADGAAGSGEAASALGEGRGLDARSRAFFEPRFGVDLGGVRVHDDADAAQASRALGARAFAVGGHIAFAAGEHQPESPDGQRLLAHELAHVVQPPSARVGRQMDGGTTVADMDAAIPDAGPEPTDASLPGGVPGVPEVPDVPDVPDVPTTPTPIVGPGGPCASPEEEARRDAFSRRGDMHLERNIPSTQYGVFDAAYLPMLGLMPVQVRIRFEFMDAISPGNVGIMASDLAMGRSIDRFFWADAEEDAFRSDFTAAVVSRWSGAFTMRSTKPCWGFVATPVVSVGTTASGADAHFHVLVHRWPDPSVEGIAMTEGPYLDDPDLPGKAFLWEEDAEEISDFNSRSVAADERRRLEIALITNAASPLRFAAGSDEIDAAGQQGLLAFAAACRARNPSDPSIPILVLGYANDPGEAAEADGLSLRRAEAVAAVLSGAGVTQPVTAIGKGASGAAGHGVVLVFDAGFEDGYHGNRFSTAAHEFGHMLGLTDEYETDQTNDTGVQDPLFMLLVEGAGVASPTWSTDTASIMSDGVDVLPRHYLTFWEALGRMTAPDIAADEWSLR